MKNAISINNLNLANNMDLENLKQNNDEES